MAAESTEQPCLFGLYCLFLVPDYHHDERSLFLSSPTFHRNISLTANASTIITNTRATRSAMPQTHKTDGEGRGRNSCAGSVFEVRFFLLRHYAIANRSKPPQ